MLKQELTEFGVFCPWCGIVSKETVEAANEKSARSVFLQSHTQTAKEGCQATTRDLVIQKVS